MRAICMFFSPLRKAKPNWLHCIGDANANAMRRTLFPPPAELHPLAPPSLRPLGPCSFPPTMPSSIPLSLPTAVRVLFCAAVVLARGRRHVGRIVGGVTFATVAIQGATAWSSSFHADVAIAGFRLASDAQRIFLSHTDAEEPLRLSLMWATPGFAFRMPTSRKCM